MALTIAFAGDLPSACSTRNVMPSSTDDAFSLTIHNASSTDYTLKIATVAALVFTPIVLLYIRGWTYWVFRKRISTAMIPPAQDPVVSAPANR